MSVTRETYAARIADGLCGICGREREQKNRRRCNRCLKIACKAVSTYQKSLHRRRLCVTCGAPSEGAYRCGTCATKSFERHRLRYQRFKDLVFEHYGGYRCACCAETRSQFLTLDHIDGGGALERKRLGVAGHYYKWLIESGYSTKLQVLCWNCNCGRYKNGGVCPHAQERGA